MAQKLSRSMREDKGLSLVEVVVALALIGIIATAAAMFFISGLVTNKELRMEQVAASVANQALDAARAVSPRPPTVGSVSGVLKGRAQADVEAAFAAANPVDIADMVTTEAWDPTGFVGTADDWVPLTSDTQIANTKYKVTTLIGGCYRPKSASTTEQNCEVAGSDATHVLIYRVRAIVSWTEKNCPEGGDSCTYRATALIDPSADAYWNTNLKPYPVDDDIVVSAGDTVPNTTAVIGNDDIDQTLLPPGFQPIINQNVDVAAAHAANGYPAIADIGVLSYLPGDDQYSGTDEFSYKLRNGQYVSSDNHAVVRVRILPRAVDDSFRVPTGEETELDVFDNDQGKVNGQGLTKRIIPTMSATLDVTSPNPDPALVASRQADAQALADMGLSVDGTSLKIDPPSSIADGTIVNVYYYLADVAEGENGGDDIIYPSMVRAHVQIVVGDCMNIADHTITLTADMLGDNDLDINGLNGNKPNCKMQFTGVNWNPIGIRGEPKLDGENWRGTAQDFGKTGSVFTYKFQDDIPYYFELSYRMVIGGVPSGEVKTIKIIVNPLANDDFYDVQLGTNDQNNVFRPQNSVSGSLRANDYPANGGQVDIMIVSGLPANCGTFTQGLSTSNGEQFLNNNGIVYRPPTTAKNCRFTYRLVPSNSQLRALGIQSNIARVTFKVGSPTINNEIDSVWSNYPQTPNIGNSAIERVENITDSNSGSKWFVGLNNFTPTGSRPIEAIYTLTEPFSLSRYSITSANDVRDRDPNRWRIYGSNSAAAAENPGHNSWVELDYRTGENWPNRHQRREFTIGEPGVYQYYRLSVERMRNGTTDFQIADWTLEAE